MPLLYPVDLPGPLSPQIPSLIFCCAPKMIMSYSAKVEMSYSKLQYPDVIGGYCDGQGHDHNEQERDKKTAHYPPGVG